MTVEMAPVVFNNCSVVVTNTVPVCAVMAPTFKVPVFVVALTPLVSVNLKLPTFVVPVKVMAPPISESLLVIVALPVRPPVVTLTLTLGANAALPVLKPDDEPILAPFVDRVIVPAVAS